MLTRGHEWGDDFASYILQAKSILDVQTQEFVDHNSITILESSNRVGPIAYPWGYPLLLTPVYAIKGNHPLALKLPGLFFYAAFLFISYLLFKTRLTPSQSLLVVALFAFNPLMLTFLDQIASDVPFLFFSTLALLLMAPWDKDKSSRYVLLGLVIAGAFFIRTTGILLLGAFLAAELFGAVGNTARRGSFRKIVWNGLIVVGTFVIVWILYALVFPGGGESYFAQYEGFSPARVFKSISAYFNVLSLFFGEHALWKALYYVLVPFFLIGCWQQRRQDLHFIIFFILWMMVLITWPFWQGPRFIFPLLPVFIYFVFVGLKFIVSKLPATYQQMGYWSLHGVWGVIVVVFLITSGRQAYTNLLNNRSINGPYDSYSREVYDYLKKNTPADSLVVFFKPRAMRLMSDRDSIVSTECDRILKGDYLVLSKKVGKNQQIPPEEIDACNLPLAEVLENTRFVVYQIRK